MVRRSFQGGPRLSIGLIGAGRGRIFRDHPPRAGARARELVGACRLLMRVHPTIAGHPSLALQPLALQHGVPSRAAQAAGPDSGRSRSWRGSRPPVTRSLLPVVARPRTYPSGPSRRSEVIGSGGTARRRAGSPACRPGSDGPALPVPRTPGGPQPFGPVAEVDRLQPGRDDPLSARSPATRRPASVSVSRTSRRRPPVLRSPDPCPAAFRSGG